MVRPKLEKKRKHRTLRRIGRIFLVLFTIVVVLILFIRSRWGQDIIVTEATNYVSEKTGTTVDIEKLFVTFAGGVQLEGLYMEDTKGDTLIYSKSLEADVAFSSLFFGNELHLKDLEWQGVTANVTRASDTEKFNFDFLIDAFATEEPAPAPVDTEPMQISIGTIDLADFKLAYTDDFMGIATELHLGQLHLDAENIDLEAMRFEFEEVALSNTNIQYQQSKPIANEEPTDSALPYFAVDELRIKNISGTYNSIPDRLLADINIGDFLLELPKADIAKNDIAIDHIRLKDSQIAFEMNPTTEETDEVVPATSSDFRWPQFMVEVGEIDFENNLIGYSIGQKNAAPEQFDPNNLAFANFKLSAEDVAYRPENISLKLRQLAFSEKSGFRLKNAGFNGQLGADSAMLSELKLETNNSLVYGEGTLRYASVAEFIDRPEDTRVAIALSQIRIALEDAFPFQPDLAKDQYLKKAASNPFTGNLQAKGTLAAIDISDFDLNWGADTSLKAIGKVQNLIQPDSLRFDFSTIEAVSNRKDVLRFISEADLGIAVPQNIRLKATAEGRPSDVKFDAGLVIPEGKAQLVGRYSDKQTMAFEGRLQVDSLQLDKLLQSEQLGAVSFSIDATGSGASLNTLNASLASDFNQLQFRGYDFSNLQLEGDITNGKGDINLNFKDANLNVKANTQVDLDSIVSEIKIDLNLIGADLYALGITKEPIKTGVNMKAEFVGNAANFSLNALFSEGIAVYDNEQYQMGDIDLKTEIGTTTTAVAIKSNFLNGNLDSNASPEQFSNALKQQFEGYFSNRRAQDTMARSVKLELHLAVTPVPLLTEVFLRDVQRLDTISIHADFDAASKILNADVHMPSGMYAGVGVDSLHVTVEGDADNLDFSAGIGSLIADPVQMQQTVFTGNLNSNELYLDFTSYDKKEELVHVASELTFAKDTLAVHINPSKLLFNKREWDIPQDNRLALSENYVGLQNMILSRNDQKIIVSDAVEGTDKNHLGARFEDFKLQTFVSLLNPDDALAEGAVNGKLVVENPFEAPGIVADFKISDFKVMQNALGNLSLDAFSKGSGAYDFDLALKDGGADLDLTGDYMAAETGARLNLDLDINKLELTLVQGLTDGALKEGEGFISGKVAVNGSTTLPEYTGELQFNGVGFNVATLNALFKIDDQSLNVDNKGLFLDNFRIKDANDNSFTLDGNILTEELTNPEFDFRAKASQFQVLNSTKEDNELFYGLASLDADITVKGNLDLPKIEGKLGVRKITDITYVVPEEQLDVEELDGVVIFVNRENPDVILTRNDQEVTPAFFRGIDAEAILEIADDAVFHIIIDERTGDNLQVSGDAALNLNIEPNGRISLSGRYELNTGHYETNLYNLVKRKFEISPGSTITWQGDPTDAKLNVTASYNLETSAAPLMSSVTSGEDASVTGKYRQVLPFVVYLNVDGELLEPKLSFALDMPEDQQGSLGGAVYGRVQQLNEQESELNKQVFSLLALNRFFPATGSDGSGGGTAAIARDNVNKVLSGQLNAFSDKIFGKNGFELDFDLDSFTDYQGDAPQDRTQLNINAKKKLFNDRLIVTAGSAVDVEGSAQSGQGETPIIGNVSLEYLLSENGRYRLKGFRKNEYTNVIDGQLIVTGLALIFQREFNKFSELFNPIPETEEQKTPRNKEDKD